MKKLSSLFYGFAVLSAVVFSGCSGNQSHEMPKANFETMKVTTQDITLDNKYSANIEGRQDIEVYPQVGGTLQQLLVTEGQKVTKGQVMFVIDQVPYQAALNTALASQKAAEAAEATAQLNYDSKKTLREQNVISEFDLKTAYNSLMSAKAQVAQCKAQVVNARNSLSYTTVKSPANGVVGTLPYRQGALVSSAMAQPLTTVTDISKMFVYFSMTEADVLSMCRKSGSLSGAIQSMPEISMALIDGSEYGEKGKVESISGVVDKTTGSVQVRAVFDNKEGLLHSGSTGNVIMPMEYKGVIVIPTAATVQLQTRYKVYVVDEKNIAHEQLVTLGRQTDGEHVIVTEGLKVGQTIVAAGAGMLTNGQNVKPNK